MKGKDVILGLLLEMPRTGYEIHEMFQTVFSHFFSGGYGMIYPTLKKLESTGEVRKEVVIQEGKPNKNIYHITKKGRQAFKNYLQTEIGDDVFQSEFLVRLYFGSHVNDELLNIWLMEEKERIEEKIRKLKRVDRKWSCNMTQTQKISFDFGMSMYQAQLEVVKKYSVGNVSDE
ncbi:PadR family transcriptional regulator [Sporolactobacillus sp. Y61]|jgi:DNA-binding PadR family transcriptional regulator|uniref:PadR family transcriptional regulator n=2 Tax=unclassified Sporolactobacillus TaxID=2628533 RepID=A0AAU8IE35_9BACL|nr:PadR family transcriptional regulator [Sporolactobacillus sp. THM19-2]